MVNEAGNLERHRAIATGDISGSYNAIGDGAQVVINQIKQAYSAIEELDKEDQLVERRLLKAIDGIIQSFLSRIQRDRSDRLNPYKALINYHMEDAPFFYGRTEAIDALWHHIHQDPLTILHAESGAGKTSLLQAGLQAQLLAEGHLPLYIRPYNQPPGDAIKRAFLPDIRSLPELRRLVNSPLDAFLTRVCQRLGRSCLYILLDQFEEFFVELLPEQQKTFATELAACLQRSNLDVRWVLALRKEHFSDLNIFHPDIPNPFQNNYRLSSFTPDEAREVIIKPAEKKQVSYEAGLVDQILKDLSQIDGRLAPPQIQLVCHTLFDELNATPDHRLITQKLYQKPRGPGGPGAKGILSTHLSRVLSQMKAPERILARQILETLVTSESRRIVKSKDTLLGELGRTPTEAEVQQVEDVLEILVDHRLLRTDIGETDQPRYELAHDYLLAEIELDPETRARKYAQEMLNLEVTLWRHNQALRIPADKLKIIKTQEAYLIVDREAKELLRVSQEVVEAAEREKEVARRRELEDARKLAEEAEARRRAEMERAQEAEAREREQAQASTELRKRNTWLRGFGLALAIVAVAAILFGVRSCQNAELAATREEEAVNAQQTASAESSRANLQAQLKEASALAEAAASSMDTDPELSISLATQAFSVTDKITAFSGNTETPFLAEEHNVLRQIEQILHQAIQTSRVRGTFEHTDEVLSVQFSRDGTLLATGSKNGEVRIWEARTGRLKHLISDHSGPVEDLVFSLDNTFLITGSQDTTVKIWDVRSGSRQNSISVDTGVEGVDISPDGIYLAVGESNGKVTIFDTKTGRPLHHLIEHEQAVYDVEFSQDGKYLATASKDTAIKIWGTKEWQLIQTLSGHKNWVWAVTFNPNAPYIASASQDETFKIWNYMTGEELQTVHGQSNAVWEIEYSPDGLRLATANADGTIKLWNATTGQLLLTLSGHKSVVRQIAFSPDDSYLASASQDKSARVWSVAGHSDIAYDVTFSPDGQRMATSSRDGTVKMWQIITPTQQSPVLEVQERKLPFPIKHSAAVRRIAFSPNGAYLATASADGTARLWDAHSGQDLKVIMNHRDGIVGVAFSPDGNYVATTSLDTTAKLWRLIVGATSDSISLQPWQTLSGHQDWVTEVAFSPNGTQLATASFDKSVRIWDIASGQEVGRLNQSQQPQPLGTVAYTHDGSKLAAAGVSGTVIVWDVETQTELQRFSDHTNWVRDVAFSADGQRLATVSYDKSIKIYDVAKDRLILSINNNALLDGVAFNPVNSNYLATANGDGTLHLYLLNDTSALRLWANRRLHPSTEANCQQAIGCP
jgi:WD40 repeat protein